MKSSGDGEYDDTQENESASTNESITEQKNHVEASQVHSLEATDREGQHESDNNGEKQEPITSLFSNKRDGPRCANDGSQQDTTVPAKIENNPHKSISGNYGFPPSPRLHPSQEALVGRASQNTSSASILGFAQPPVQLRAAQHDPKISNLLLSQNNDNPHVSEDTNTSDEPRGRHEYRHEDLPIQVNVQPPMDDDDFTDVSSVTTTHFQGRELFVPHMYPSTQNVGDLDDITVSEIGMDPRVPEGGAEDTHPPVEGTEDTEATSNLDDLNAKLETQRLAHGAEDLGPVHYVDSASEHQDETSWTSIFSHPMPEIPSQRAGNPQNLTKNSGASSSENESANGGNDPHSGTSSSEMQGRGSWISNFLSLPHPASQENPSQQSDPGAYRMFPFGSLASRERDEEEESDGLEMMDLEYQQEESQVGDSELVQAWPVSDELATATPLHELPEDRSSGTFFSGKLSRWKILFFGLTAMLAAVIATSVMIPPLFANDPRKIEYLKIKSTILDAFGKEYFDNPQKERALHWIVYEDPRNVLSVKEEGHLENLVQRFSLVAFYFQTSSQQPWTYCNPPTSKEPDTCYFRVVSSFPRNSIGTRWLTGANECHWMGVFCTEGRGSVTGLWIEKSNLTGTIPESELSMLTQLEVLQLRGNNLAGVIPSKIFQSYTINKIDLGRNNLTGTIPSLAFSAPGLNEVSLFRNKLTGSIPTEVGCFKGSVLLFPGNFLTGSIPSQIYTARNLKSMDLGNNALSGTLSSSLGLLTELKELWLSGNPIQGYIPSETGLLQLRRLSLEKTKTSGTLPEELYQNKDFQRLLLSDCMLTGTISTRIGELKSLEFFHVANNRLNGTIPRELSSAAINMESVHLHGNPDLLGSIPNGFCSHMLPNCKVTADCTPKAATGVPSVHCPAHCCSMCCDSETEICLEQ